MFLVISATGRGIELGIGLIELGIDLRISNARRTVLARVSGLVISPFSYYLSHLQAVFSFSLFTFLLSPFLDFLLHFLLSFLRSYDSFLYSVYFFVLCMQSCFGYFFFSPFYVPLFFHSFILFHP